MAMPYILDWLNLLLRWGHLVTGIAWIGASFYFIWLDNSLEEPSEDNKNKGIGGQLNSIHGGGFYEVAKYKLAPPKMPQTLHWFKWEAYSTWITGFFLLALMYYVGAESYLVDPTKYPLQPWQGIVLSLATLGIGWFIYDALCKSPLARNGWILAGVLLILIGLSAWALGNVFSDRAAFLHVGALIGTCMAANVFFVIIPGQKALVAAVEAGRAPDTKYARASKLRSVHNNYLTLPILFLMISNHYPMTYGHQHAWAVLLAIVLLGAWTRHFFNLRHKGIFKPSILISALIGFALLAWVMSPRAVLPPQNKTAGLTDTQAHAMVRQHCAGCHSANPTDEIFTVAPGGVLLESPEHIRQWMGRIQMRVLISKDMPFMNKTGMTEEERMQLGEWLSAQ
ncbi:MAG: urate hydroxylase PuuD [Cellvibrionaceae bacterium]|nr:urate hydroxylase PuuD [Cellvibrionaceae bacterium]